MTSQSKVLIIDDNADLTAVLESFLYQRGYSVSIAHEGLRGIEYAHKQQPGLILLDLNLPVGKGPEVLKALQKHEDTKHIPVLIITGLSLNDIERQKLVRDGVKEIIFKPFKNEALLEKIQRHFHHF